MTAGRPRVVFLEDLSEAATLRDRNHSWRQIGDLLGIDPGTLRAAFHLFREGRRYPHRSRDPNAILNTVSESGPASGKEAL